MRRVDKRAVLLLVSFLLLQAPPAMPAEVYRWVDENGRVHYGDRPAGKQAEPLEIRPPSVQGDAGMARRRERQEKLLRVLEEERREKKEAQEKARAEQEARAQRCKEARERLSRYEHASYLYREQEDGSRVVLEGEAHDRALREAREAVRRLCE